MRIRPNLPASKPASQLTPHHHDAPSSRMAFSAIMTMTLLLSKIIFRFWRHPDQLAILRAPVVISAAVAPWRDGALQERLLDVLLSSAEASGRAALKQLGRRLVELGTELLRECAAPGEEEQAGCGS